MNTPITLPDLGVSPGRPITLSAWYVLPGELVLEGERVVEVLTEGATFDVAAPATGCLIEHLARPRDPLHVGQSLGMIASSRAKDEEA